MTQTEIKKSITDAMNEPKAPAELVEKGLAIARAYTKAHQAGKKEIKPEDKRIEDKKIEDPVNSIGGGGLRL